MEYKITQEDLDKCFNFALEYHLDKTKLASNRTTGQYRGLGGIIDSFVIGKLIEIGISKILEKNTGKKIILDFDIHRLNKNNISDPDILKIIENNKERDPNLYVEIKNISPDDRWIGLTSEQFNTIIFNRLVEHNPKKVMLIYATLVKKTQDGDIDPLGVYLKSKINLELLKKFCNVGDLYVKIQYVLSGKDLNDFGISFNQGSYLYETEIIKETRSLTVEKIKKSEQKYEKINIESNKLPVIMGNLFPEPKEFGEFLYYGNIDVFIKKNYKNGKISSRRMYIRCNSDTIIKNAVLGTFSLKKDKIYECWFSTVGMNPILKRNNIWIAQRNLINILSKRPEDYLEEIKQRI